MEALREVLADRSRHRRALMAALRLGAIYVAGVLATFLPVYVATADPETLIGDLRGLSSIFGGLFALAFLVLAIARRFGFAILWAVLLAVWCVGLQQGGFHGPDAGELFVIWTILAAPLLAMQSLGAPPRSTPAPRWHRAVARAGAGVWALGVTVKVLNWSAHPARGPLLSESAAAAVAWLVWLPGPVVVTALALAALYRLEPRPDGTAGAP